MPLKVECTAQMAKLGIADFPTFAEVQQAQEKLLRRLESSSIIPTLYEGLENCRSTQCGRGRDRCSDACRFGAYRKKRKLIPLIHWLLTEHDGPLYEVRVRRVVWSQPFGDLRPSLGALKKLNRRALYNLYDPDVVAVGTCKVSVTADDYRCEIHQIIAGAEQDDLKRAFVPSEMVESTGFFWTKNVENLGEVISDVLDHGLRRWKNPRQRESANEVPEAAKFTGWSSVSPALFSADPAAPSNVTKNCWPEYYAWRLGLTDGACIIRYGCDRYFNALHKAQRTRVIKVRKRRFGAWQLERYRYGTHDSGCGCQICLGSEH